MASDPKQLRKAYEYKLGKDIADKLSDDQISELSKYYNSLTPDQQRNVDSELVKGKGEFLNTARSMADPIKYSSDRSLLPNQKYKSENKGGSISTIVRKAKKASYQETNTNKSAEDIDPEILEMLGLDDATDLDYGEYKTLLKEQMMAGRMGGTQMSSEDTERLTNEFKRVKANTGKFVINSSNIKQSTYAPRTRTSSGGGETTDVLALLESSKERNNDQDEKINSILTTVPISIAGITKILQDVNNILGVSVAVEEDNLKAQKEKDLQRQRDEEERARESGARKLGGFKKPNIPKPKIPFMDRIKQFFGNVLMGGLVVGLLEWIQDPKNQESIDNFVDFIVDKGPLILGGILALMALPIGATMIKLTATILGLTKALSLAALKLAPAFAGLAVIIAGLEFVNRSKKVTQRSIDRENKRRAKEGKPPMTPQEEADYLSRPNQIAEDATEFLGGGDDMDREVDPVGPAQDLSKIPELETSYDPRDNSRVIEVPWNPVSEGDLKRYQGLLQKAISMTTPGDGTQIRVAGVGTYKRGRNFMGLPMDQYYDVNGKSIQTPRDWQLHLDDKTEETIKGNKGKTSDFDQTPEASPQTQAVPTSSPQMGSETQVIIPLDHSRKAGAVPDETGGNTFSASRATGADGREREHQDPAAKMLKQELAKKGINAKIVRPEDFASYAEYDAYLKKMSDQGVVSVPLHFDAIQEGGGTGFLTRTRAGDSGDSALASPINQVLSDFASQNPDLGGYRTDTDGNKTVSMGAASPTALVELGEMVRWEEKYGKNFTQSDKFKELIQGVAGGIVEGGNLKPGSDAEVTSKADVPPPPPILPPPPDVPPPPPILPPPPGQNVSSRPPGPPRSPSVTVVAAAVPANGNTSGSSTRVSTIPSVGAVDQNNDTVTITKGIYSIIA